MFFIDTRVGNIDIIVADFVPDAIAIVLDPIPDGLIQISQAAAGSVLACSAALRNDGDILYYG